MSNYLERFKGVECKIKLQDYASCFDGVIVEVVDNWVNIKAFKRTLIINIDYIQVIKIKDNE